MRLQDDRTPSHKREDVKEGLRATFEQSFKDGPEELRRFFGKKYFCPLKNGHLELRNLSTIVDSVVSAIAEPGLEKTIPFVPEDMSEEVRTLFLSKTEHESIASLVRFSVAEKRGLLVLSCIGQKL